MLKTQCPHCGASYKFKDSSEGKQFKCKQCGDTFRIRSESVPPVEQPPLPQSADDFELPP